jgi:uncharacterized membrane protein
MIRLLAVVAFIWAGAVTAQELPALYDVSGVRSDDLLNIRMAPDSASDIIGTLAHTAFDIEVVARDASGSWGLVNAGEMAGWVSMYYMSISAAQPWWEMTQPIYCFGTEPFWDVKLTPRAWSTFNYFTDAIGPMTPIWESGAWGSPRRMILNHHIPNGEITSYIEAEACNDGMSDRAFGLSLQMFIQSDDGAIPQNQMRGCCSLATN